MAKFRIIPFLLLFLAITCAIPGAAAQEPDWSDEEIAFMQQHPVIRFGVDPEFVPFEFIDEKGEYRGIASDYVKKVEEITGLRFERQAGLRWEEAYDKARRKELDMLPAVGVTAERKERFLLSEPYYSFKRVIVIRDTQSGIKSFEDLYGQTVAVQKNSSHHSYLMDYPAINVSLYHTVEDALAAVAADNETAFLGNIATADHVIHSIGLTNLKFIVLEADSASDIAMAVRSDWPVLVNILDKALQSITQDEKNAIHNTWVSVAGNDAEYEQLMEVFAIVGSLLLIVAVLSIFWTMRLRREIDRARLMQAAMETAITEAENANAVKSSFLARVSHEIRTPLNAIVGMSYLLEKSEATPAQSMYIGKIMQASNNLLEIVNDILDYSKVESSAIYLSREPFALDNVLQSALHFVAKKKTSDAVFFLYQQDMDLPSWFIGDPKHLEQILINLLGNAVKFTPKGEIGFSVHLLEDDPKFAKISFTVWDTGIGMSQDKLKNLFEPFAQEDSGITRQFGGTGLGLSITKHLVDMMEGEISASSAKGEGASFTVKLTLEKDCEKEQDFHAGIEALSSQLKNVLLLMPPGEDLRMTTQFLERYGFAVDKTNLVEEAQELLEHMEYDLLILDKDALMRQSLRAKKTILLLGIREEEIPEALHDVDVAMEKPVMPTLLGEELTALFEGEYDLKPPRRTNLHVLVVEDNEMNRMIAQFLLEEAEFRPIFAENGKEAVEIFEQNKDDINIVLMDLHMPIMNGYDAAVAIHGIREDVPIVAMTADVVEGVRARCAAHGMPHYISKPFEPEVLIETINRIAV